MGFYVITDSITITPENIGINKPTLVTAIAIGAGGGVLAVEEAETAQ